MGHKIILFLTMIFLYGAASAFTYNTNTGAHFQKEKIYIYVASNSSCVTTGTTISELLSVAKEAAEDFWNKVPSAKLELVVKDEFQTADVNFLTGTLCLAGTSGCVAPIIPKVNNIVIVCNSSGTNFPSSSILALTLPNNITGTTIKGAVIAINDVHANRFGGLTHQEKVSLLAHEIGHALGLGHTDESALMNYKLIAKRFKLGEDDVRGITSLYPMPLESGVGCNAIGAENKNQKINPPVIPEGFITMIFAILLTIGLKLFF